jgi:hypothetical protein
MQEEHSRPQVDHEPSISGEPVGAPDGSPVHRGRGALCLSEGEKGIGFALTSIVAVSVKFALNAASI